MAYLQSITMLKIIRVIWLGSFAAGIAKLLELLR
jgi:hypothetical protein